MHIQLFFASVLLTIVPQAVAYVYSTQSLCKTTYATTPPASVKSTSYSLTIPLTFTKKYTSTPTVTITLAPISTIVTTTSTITIIIPTATTSTIYTTTTSTGTVSTTSTQTSTTTTTVPGITVTVPPPAGFTPITSDGTYQPKKRSGPLAVKGKLAKRATASSFCQFPYPTSPHSFTPAIYPTAITCGYLVEAITTTTKTISATTTAKTTLAPTTKTGTSTVFTTSTSFSTLPGVSTTITVSALPATTTSTITTSTTTTVTVIAPTATFYAACAANNTVNSANGGHGIPFVYAFGGFTSTSDTTPYDCCVSCVTGVPCFGYVFLSTCYNIESIFYNYCDGSDDRFAQFESEDGYPPSDGYTIGNGLCGQIGDIGEEPAGSSPDPPAPPIIS